MLVLRVVWYSMLFEVAVKRPVGLARTQHAFWDLRSQQSPHRPTTKAEPSFYNLLRFHGGALVFVCVRNPFKWNSLLRNKNIITLLARRTCSGSHQTEESDLMETAFPEHSINLMPLESQYQEMFCLQSLRIQAVKMKFSYVYLHNLFSGNQWKEPGCIHSLKTQHAAFPPMFFSSKYVHSRQNKANRLRQCYKSFSKYNATSRQEPWRIWRSLRTSHQL